MISREVSLFIFYNEKGEILLQDRKRISKAGEEWGFFGGALEDDESPKEALKREVKEELNLDLNNDLQELGSTVSSYFNGRQNQQVNLKRHIFTKKYSGEKIKILEGSGAKWFDLTTAKQLKLVPGDEGVVNIVSKYLEEKND